MGHANSKADLADILVTLSQTDVSPDAHDFWDELWKLSTTPEDVFELIAPEDVRRLKAERSENVVTLFTQAVAQLCQIVHTPVPMYFGQALNCLRILTRLLPFLLERENDDFVEQLCWGVEEEQTRRSGEAKPDEPDGDGDESAEPLARLIVHAAMHLLFLPAFTVDATAFEEEVEDLDADPTLALPVSALWAGGLGSFNAAPPSATSFDWNRVEVMRLLLAALCEPLYQSAEHFDPWRSRWLAAACARDSPNAKLLLYSLLNVIFSYDPIGFGLPYGSQLVSEAPTQLVSVAAQTVIVLLDYGTPAAVAAEKGAGEKVNVFRELLSQLEGAEAYEFAFSGLSRLLNNVWESLNTTLPNSLAQVECYQELLVLLWKLLEENAGFMPYILRNCDVTRLVTPVCFLQYQARRDPARVGLVHICTFILLKLSGERAFCVALNKPFVDRLPVDLPLFAGSHADLVVITLHKMVVNGGDKLAALYNCFLTIICNLSPYAKSLSLVASVKLVNLFELFTSPRFLYAAETNHVYVALLLEVFNNIVQYQYGGNPHLVYAVVRRKHAFDALEKLTLPIAQAAAKDTPALEQAVAPSAVVATEERPEDAPLDANVPDQTAAPVVSPLFAAADQTAEPVAAPSAPANAPANAAAALEIQAPAPKTDAPKTDAHAHNAGFVPTEDWLRQVKSELPLNTIMRLLHHLAPQIDELVARSEFALDEQSILDFIKNTTMVGLLPVPHAIVIRKYQPNTFTSLWFTAFLWGVIFLQNQVLPLYDGGSIKLFTVSVV